MGIPRFKSWGASSNRVRQARCRLLKKRRPNIACRGVCSSSGERAVCLRCRCRSDKCAARGCVPYKFTWQAAALNLVAKRLEEERVDDDGCRFPADCIDLQCVVMWAQKATDQVSMKVALFGCCVFSHFNPARTFGVLMWHGALASTCPDWKTCKGNPLLQKALGRTLLQNEYGWQRLPKSSGRD